jgi:hypothetical protein
MRIRYGKLSPYKLRKILHCFCEDLTATQTARVTGINRNTVNRYYRIFREKIAAYQEEQAQQQGFAGEIGLHPEVGPIMVGKLALYVVLLQPYS